MDQNMLKQEDKIFKNLYNDHGWELNRSNVMIGKIQKKLFLKEKNGLLMRLKPQN